MLWLFHPPLSKEEEETYEGSAPTAGGTDMHSYTETQSWEGPLLQGREGVCTGSAAALGRHCFS